jgi:cysteinyl-tRNA synthetase
VKGNVDKDVIDALCDDLNTSEAITRLRALFDSAKKDAGAIGNFARTAAFLGFQNLLKSGVFHSTFSANMYDSGPQLDETAREQVVRYRAASANNLVMIADQARSSLESIGFRVSLNQSGVLVVSNQTSADVDLDFKERVDKLVDERVRARAQRNWKESDRIRDQLSAMGVALKDSKEGTTWELKR